MFLEFLINLITPVAVSLILGFSPSETALVVIGVFLIDIDHLFYMLYDPKIKSVSDGLSFTKREYKKHNPHFYLFHTVEFIIIFLVISFLYFENGLLYIALGFIINFIIDIFTYLIYYKKTDPWLKYLSLFYYLTFK